jgi:hypothetical protein
VGRGAGYRSVGENQGNIGSPDQLAKNLDHTTYHHRKLSGQEGKGRTQRKPELDQVDLWVPSLDS